MTIDLHSDNWHLFLASAFELGLSPHLYTNLACGVAAQEERVRVPGIDPTSVEDIFCPILFPWGSC